MTIQEFTLLIGAIPWVGMFLTGITLMIQARRN